MTKTKKHIFSRVTAILAAIAMVISMQCLAPASASAQNDVEINISNLSATPASCKSGAGVRVTFDYQFTLTATGSAHFKKDDKIAVQTNFAEIFKSDTSFTVPVRDHGGNQLGDLHYNANNGAVTLTVSEDAENMEFHTLTGTFDSFKHFTAKSVDATTDYTLKAGIGADTEAQKPFRIEVPDRVLKINSSGNGTISGITGSVVLNDGDKVTISATPNDSNDPAKPNEVLAVTLVRADGTTKAYGGSLLPSSVKVNFEILYAELKPGTNTLNIVFTKDVQISDQDAWGFMDYNDVWKNVWGVDWNSYAQNDISIGGAAVTNLYGSMGARCGANDNDKSHDLSDLIIEEHVPGGTAGTIRNGQVKIEAVLPNYWPIKNSGGEITGYKPFRVEAGRIGDWSGRVYPFGQTDLVAAGKIARIEPSANESYDDFLGRIKAKPLSYGVYIDPSTKETSILANLGSPGDPDAPGWKCSELWPDKLALDPILNQINGDGNCVNGKVQAFRLWFYTDHSRTIYTTTYTNVVEYSAVTGAGTKIDRAKRTASYTITRDNTLGEGKKSTLTVYVVDAHDQSQGISGVELKLEKWNAAENSWEDANHAGRTADGGDLVLGDEIGVDTGTLTPGKYRIREVSVPDGYAAKTTDINTANSSQGTISKAGEFTVASTDSKGFVALVMISKAYDMIYHANGGEGTLVCPDNPHPRDTKAIVLSPGDAITKSGHYFVGWNTDEGGNGDWYAPGDEIAITDHDVDLYAQWKLNKKATTSLTGTKVWDDNDNANGKRPAITANNGQPVDLELVNLNDYTFPEGTEKPKPVWTQDEKDPNKWSYIFTGLPQYDADNNLITWCAVEKPPKGYTASYENSESWDYLTDRAYQGGVIKNKLKDVKITYALSGGSYNGSTADITETYKYGTKIKVHAAPVREGFTFRYWEGSRYEPEQEYEVSEDHVFTAVWKQNDTGTTDPGSDDSSSSVQNESGKSVQSSSQRTSASKTPNTGDDGRVALFVTAMAASLGLLTVLLFRRRRARR